MIQSKGTKKFRKINNLPVLHNNDNSSDGMQNQAANINSSIGYSNQPNYAINPKTGNYFRRNTSN